LTKAKSTSTFFIFILKRSGLFFALSLVQLGLFLLGGYRNGGGEFLPKFPDNSG
jgi:hypothetical protein